MPPASPRPSRSEQITDVRVDEELSTSFLAYSLSVITSRALPDIRDGLKPVQRRILYGAWESGARPDSPYRKSAAVVGHVMGRYHPHGDAAIYDAMVRLAQPFSLLVPLVDGHGNFGSLDDGPAAARYTEARLAPAGAALLGGGEIGEDAVDLRANYSQDTTEPVVLPAAFPALLVNGASGIAVGMSTNLAPHNLAEVTAAALLLNDDPAAPDEALEKLMPGPDFPSGGLLLGGDEVRSAERDGRGALRLRARATIENAGRGSRIVITELPYQVSPEKVIARVRALNSDKRLDGVLRIVDETDSAHGLRLVVDVRAGVNANALLRKLYALTPLETSFHVANVALVDGTPTTVGIRAMLLAWLTHRREVIRRRSAHRQAKAEARAHLVEGLLTALASIDEVVEVIRRSRDTGTARDKLRRAFKLSEAQVDHVLEMPLRRLTSLEVSKLKAELTELRRTIKDLARIVSNEKRRREVLASELTELSARFAEARRTEIVTAIPDDDLADAEADVEHPDTPCRVEFTTTGKLRRVDAGAPAPRRRTHRVVVSATDVTGRAEVGLVSDRGRLWRVTAGDVPAEGVDAGILVALDAGEHLVGVVALSGAALGFMTAQGFVKRLDPSALSPKAEQSVIGLRSPEDRVRAVFSAPDGAEVVAVSSAGQALRFPAAAVRPQGRSGSGMAGMRLADGAVVVAVGPADDGAQIGLVTDSVSAKVVMAAEVPTKGRGGGGVRVVRFRAGESSVALAAVGVGVVGANSSGSALALGSPTKREAAAAALDTTINAVGVQP